MQQFFDNFKDKIPKDCPTEFLLETLTIIMKENIFQFGNNFWLQLMGCAMGTSAAFNYSYTYICLLKMSGLLKESSEYLLFYKRFINNIIEMWNYNKKDSLTKFDEFFKQLNKWGKLWWTSTGFSSELIFTNLSIGIRENRLHFKTFQKEHNLYLYIPPLSAHLFDMFRSLIFGRL